MRALRYSLLFMTLLTAALQAQDNTWFTISTDEVGFTQGEYALRINSCDINSDTYPDIITIQKYYRRGDIRIYLNVQRPGSQDPHDRMFVDWTDSSGINRHPTLDTTKETEVLCFGDLDNDGDLDVINGIWHYRSTDPPYPEDRSEVMLNDGQGHFSHVASDGFEGLGLISASGFTYLDYDHDGILDVYIATYWDSPDGPFQRDRLMKGRGDGTFYDVSNDARVTASWPMQGASAVDWNNDGWTDIMTSPYCRSDGSLLRNGGDGTFLDIGRTAGYNARTMQGDNGQNLCQWGAYPYDYDNDGDMDVLQVLVHGGLDQDEGRTVIATNQGAEFNYWLEWELDRLHRSNPQSSHLGNMDGAWLDFDNNMLVDLIHTECEYLDGTDRPFFYQQLPDNQFYDITPYLGIIGKIRSPHSLEVIDYDLDGDYDVVMSSNSFSGGGGGADRSKLVFLKNNIGQNKSWLGVRLIGSARMNRGAIGARVTVISNGVRQMQEIHAGRGHFSGQQDHALLFGMGTGSIADSVIVRWPVNPPVTSVLTNVPLNRYMTIDATVVSVGSAPVASSPRMQAYPNPAWSTVHLAMQDVREADLRIYDALGRLVHVQRATSNTVVDVSGLRPGLYLATAHHAGEVLRTRFIVGK